MRGGTSYIPKRYSQANKEYLKSFVPKQELKYIIYLDANNSDGYAISKFLPTSKCKWIDLKQFDLKNTIAIVQRVVLSKLILIIIKNYMKYMTLIL